MRKILNFGHTLGHGIEAIMEPKLYHGECVALGMLPMCEGEAREKLIHVLQKVGLPTTCSVPVDDMMRAVSHDKKATAGGVDCVLVSEVGKGRVVNLSIGELRRRAEEYFKK